MKSAKSIVLSLAAAASLGLTATAGAENLSSVSLVSHAKQFETGQFNNKFTKFQMVWRAFNPGLHHVCEVSWTPDGWIHYQTTPAVFQGFGGGGENWLVSASTGGHVNIEYVFRCTDLGLSVRQTLANGAAIDSHGLTVQGPVSFIP